MITRRSLSAVSGVLFAAAAAVACTLTQSLDYLQKGDGLTDGGAVEASVPEGGSEAGGRAATVLVPNQTKPGFLAQDATTLYWIAGGTVMSVAKSGGTPKALGPVPPSATALVAEPDPAGAVFVVNGGTVLRVPKDGSDSGVAFTTAPADPPTDTIAASASALYVLQYDPSGLVEGSRILRVAKSGGTAVDIAPDAGPVTLSLDSKSVFWLGTNVDKPAIFEQAEKSAAGTTTAVYALSANDDAPTLSADIAIDDTSLYWVTSNATSGTAEIVGRKRQAVASAVAIYRGAADDVFANLSIDATHAYFLEKKRSSLLRVPKNGGDVETLLVGLKAPSGLVVDGTAAYLTVEATGNTGQVLVLTK